MDRRRVFTNKKRPKGKNMSDGKIMCTDEGDTKARVFFFIDTVASRSCGMEKQELCLILMAPSF